jgi:hypothetical protein
MSEPMEQWFNGLYSRARALATEADDVSNRAFRKIRDKGRELDAERAALEQRVAELEVALRERGKMLDECETCYMNRLVRESDALAPKEAR